MTLSYQGVFQPETENPLLMTIAMPNTISELISVETELAAGNRDLAS
jgi:hypothetical protein